MDERLTALYGRLPQGWEAWVGITGTLYARRKLSSPPIVLKAVTPDEIVRAARQAVPRDFDDESSWRVQPPWEARTSAS